MYVFWGVREESFQNCIKFGHFPEPITDDLNNFSLIIAVYINFCNTGSQPATDIASYVVSFLKSLLLRALPNHRVKN